MSTLVYIDLYQKRSLTRLLGRPQPWRWRALNGDNFRVLAVSSEAYTNRADALAAIEELFGTSSNVYRRESEQGNTELRLADAA